MSKIISSGGEINCSLAKDILPPQPAFRPLVSATAAEIGKADLQPPPFIIEGLLPVGMTVFAAPPKTGKSWFCLDMACAIAEGRRFFGRRCTPGRVLYLDLESRNYRVKSRMQACGLRGPDNLHFAFESENLNGGLLTQLTAWLQQYPDTSVVIIDTLGRVKGFSPRNADAYTADTVTLAPIQAWALQNGVAVICVTHLRKSGAARYDADADPFERITGSNAQFGVADTAWIIAGKRDDDERHFIASGRDIEAVDLAIMFNKQRLRWECLGDAVIRRMDNDRREYEADPIVRTLRDLLSDCQQGELRISAADLCGAVADRFGSAGCVPSELGKRLSKISEQLYAFDRIVHSPPSTGGRKGRLHSFRYERTRALDGLQLSAPCSQTL